LLPEKVILVRHGETSWNQDGKFLGHSNPGLNERGISQARAVAGLLFSEDIDLIFSSDLRRAIETSQIIARTHKLPVIVTPFLREINFGVWEGLTFVEIEKHYPVLLSKWMKDPFKVRIPRGETAEDVRYRVIEAWNFLALKASGEKTVVIVAHGGPLRLLLCYLTGVDKSRQWDFNLGHGEVVTLKKSGKNYFVLKK